MASKRPAPDPRKDSPRPKRLLSKDNDAEYAYRRMSQLEKAGWHQISCLAGTAWAFFSQFRYSSDYASPIKNTPLESDIKFLNLKPRQQLVITTEMLSRDVKMLPANFDRTTLDEVALESAEMEFLPKGNRCIFFHSSQIELKEKAKAHYEKHAKSKAQLSYIGTSQIFQHSYSSAYEPPNIPPKIRYHFNLNDLLKNYRKMLAIDEVKFLKFETVRYIKEYMYVILVCPPNSPELEDFPVIEVDQPDWEEDRVIKISRKQNSETDETAPKVRGTSRMESRAAVQEASTDNQEASTENKKESIDSDKERGPTDQDDGNKDKFQYQLHWRPFCTRGKNDKCKSWDHVAFLFYFPPESEKKELPLPLPCKYQTITDESKRAFGDVKEAPSCEVTSLIPNDKMDDKMDKKENISMLLAFPIYAGMASNRRR